MHEVPRFTKKLRELSAVEHEDGSAASERTGTETTLHASEGCASERMPPEIAVEPRRPHSSDRPTPHGAASSCGRRRLSPTQYECPMVKRRRRLNWSSCDLRIERGTRAAQLAPSFHAGTTEPPCARGQLRAGRAPAPTRSSEARLGSSTLPVASHFLVAVEANRKADERQWKRFVAERVETIVSDHVTEVSRRTATGRIHEMCDERFRIVDDVIAGVQKANAVVLSFSVEIEQRSIAPELKEEVAAQQIGESDTPARKRDIAPETAASPPAMASHPRAPSRRRPPPHLRVFDNQFQSATKSTVVHNQGVVVEHQRRSGFAPASPWCCARRWARFLEPPE